MIVRWETQPDETFCGDNQFTGCNHETCSAKANSLHFAVLVEPMKSIGSQATRTAFVPSCPCRLLTSPIPFRRMILRLSDIAKQHAILRFAAQHDRLRTRLLMQNASYAALIVTRIDLLQPSSRHTAIWPTRDECYPCGLRRHLIIGCYSS
jgi:hypothetical protein